MRRRCTMPAIPWFRDWYEARFGDLCAAHDAAYAAGECKLCADWALVTAIVRRGWCYAPLAVGTWLAVQLPWVWAEYLWRRRRNRGRKE